MLNNILQGIGMGIGFGIIYAFAMIIIYLFNYNQSKKNQDTLMKYFQDYNKGGRGEYPESSKPIIPKKKSTDDSDEFHL